MSECCEKLANLYAELCGAHSDWHRVLMEARSYCEERNRNNVNQCVTLVLLARIAAALEKLAVAAQTR